jgi:signal transduction histidine kinase
MRAKRSSTAKGIESRSGLFTARGQAPPQNVVGVAESLGLAHDACNLVAALGLYSGLLARPGVLKPEHSHYAAELGLIGSQSATLLHRLMFALSASPAPAAGSPSSLRPQPSAAADLPTRRRAQISLREIAERCLGLLRGVAGGREMELIFGPAASKPVAAREEDVERVLVNLVRNAAAALDACRPAQPHSPKGQPTSHCDRRRPRPFGLLVDPAPPTHPIRISVGSVDDSIAYYRPHSFLHARLTVEDSGCGMDRKQLGRLLADAGPSPIPRGIGFQLVRELVEANGASLSIRSAPGAGTSVQIEWPAQIAWPLALSALPAAPTPAQQLPWPPIPVASLKSAHASESRWTA